MWHQLDTPTARRGNSRVCDAQVLNENCNSFLLRTKEKRRNGPMELKGWVTL